MDKRTKGKQDNTPKRQKGKGTTILKNIFEVLSCIFKMQHDTSLIGICTFLLFLFVLLLVWVLFISFQNFLVILGTSWYILVLFGTFWYFQFSSFLPLLPVSSCYFWFLSVSSSFSPFCVFSSFFFLLQFFPVPPCFFQFLPAFSPFLKGCFSNLTLGVWHWLPWPCFYSTSINKLY